ncbi:IS3 family transposase [Arthrobacter sp. Bz4]|uniref:IS3 family transposase n=1 Tax=Arthrobacter sp. Bz4 TaxID=2171979 RepID=UPI001A9C2D84|nr:IS3 family transposase [Arthrobacter sp. Bz4]
MKDAVMGVVTALAAKGWAVRRACQLAGVTHASYYRWLSPARPGALPGPAHRDRFQPHALGARERALVLKGLNSDEYGHLSVHQAWHRMFDNGIYLCSLSSFHRIARAAGHHGDRRDQAPRKPRTVPRHQATAPDVLWSWDITTLRGPGRQTLKLYTIIDVYSRFVVSWRVEPIEDKTLAAALIHDAVKTTGAIPDVLHADNGGPMRAGTTRDLLTSLGITASYSRPMVSNDNPYSEALFKTVKYSKEFPGRFDDLEEARAYCAWFFNDYNTAHRHSGLNGYTPESVHTGTATAAHRKRQALLNQHHRYYPERYNHPPVAKTPPTEAWINKPTNPTNLSQTG